jgi:hypothetical protein
MFDGNVVRPLKLENGVIIRKYFKHFKGKYWDADEPPISPTYPYYLQRY